MHPLPVRCSHNRKLTTITTITSTWQLTLFFTMEDLMTNQYLVNSYFQPTTDCQVCLYSCARNVSQSVTLSDGEEYQPRSCWLELYTDLVRANKFIYITGWSVWTDLKLLRGDDQNLLGKMRFDEVKYFSV